MNHQIKLIKNANIITNENDLYLLLDKNDYIAIAGTCFRSLKMKSHMTNTRGDGFRIPGFVDMIGIFPIKLDGNSWIIVGPGSTFNPTLVSIGDLKMQMEQYLKTEKGMFEFDSI
jgi:hypothetical protein